MIRSVKQRHKFTCLSVNRIAVLMKSHAISQRYTTSGQACAHRIPTKTIPTYHLSIIKYPAKDIFKMKQNI